MLYFYDDTPAIADVQDALVIDGFLLPDTVRYVGQEQYLAQWFQGIASLERHRLFELTKGCPECDKGTIFICNDGDLNRAVKDAFDKHGIDCNVDIKHLNVTKYNKDENQLSDEQKEWIRDLFSGDVEMWKRHCE